MHERAVIQANSSEFDGEFRNKIGFWLIYMSFIIFVRKSDRTSLEAVFQSLTTSMAKRPNEFSSRHTFRTEQKNSMKPFAPVIN